MKYFVLGGETEPYLLARVRWPDVAQAITVGLREWQDDIGLFDLPYDPGSRTVSLIRATAIAAGWGVLLPSDATFSSSVPPLIRRMPANWSNLAPAEKRAWGLEFVTKQLARARRESSKNRGGQSSRGSRLALWRTPVEAERRRHPRVQVGGRAQIRYGRRAVTADLVDVSLGGVHFIVLDTQAVLQPGGKLNAPIILDAGVPEGQITLDVGGTVTWQTSTGLGAHFGVAFETLNDKQVEEVHRLLVESGAERSL